MVDAALWLGGWWRELTAPLALAAALSLLLTNTAAPGEAARFIAAQGRPAARWGVGLLAAVALLALLEIARGALSPGEAALRVALLGVQLALYQHLPATLLAAALAVMVLALDRQGVSLLTRAAEIGERTVVRHGRRAAEASLAAVAALCAAAWAAAVWPDAMRGFAAVDPPDTQRFSYYASFVYRGVPEDAATERREGFEAGYYGLTLPPGASGELVIRLERNPETTVLLRPNFYNRAVADDGRGLTDRRFENALEVSAGEGQAYRPLLANRSVGEVVADEVFDLTPALGASRVYRLRFTARNTTDAPVTVLPALNVNAIPERSAIPQPTFLAAAYAASGAALLYVLLRCAAWSRRAALAGVVSASVPTALMVRVLAEVAGRRAPSGGGGAMDAL
ncbi:MAG TPA: hypothetical protein VFX49_13315, partial [Chloroflexota bacterium]|nr:hypothetical protein [Chloroflexota bacterium]